MSPALRNGAPAALAALALIGLTGGLGAASVAAAVALVLLAAGLALRPLDGTPLLVALAVGVVLVSVECDSNAGNVGWFALCLIAGWAATTHPRRIAIGFGVLCLVPPVVEQLRATDVGWGAWMAGVAVSVGASIAGREKAELVAELRAAQAGLADRAAAEERTRIAHEVHDVIGHALTVSLLHISSARLALREDVEEADRALAEAERLSRDSLTEVRSVVGLMRGGAESTPLPGAAQLDELVASFRAAGTPVELRIEGDLASLGATEGLVVYRIAQEALTNATRHAPGAAVVATVTRDAAGTRVVVDSAGAPPSVVREGSGLAGMRQRAEAVGGTLVAGPGGAGWRVEGVLP